MKRTLLTFAMLLSFALPLSAQDAACEIDLTSTVSLLVQAQGMAASGDTERALAQIALARTKLEGFEAACGAVVVDEPPTPVELALTQSFTLEEQYGGLTFNYPEGWAEAEDSGGILVGTSSEVVSRDFDTEPPPFASGEVAIFVTLGDAGSFGDSDGSDPALLLEAMAGQVPASFGEQTEVTAFNVNDQPAALFTIAGEETGLVVMAVRLGEVDGEMVFAQFILLTAPDELNVYEPTLQAVAESIEFAPPGV